jgi:hypothetical protein
MVSFTPATKSDTLKNTIQRIVDDRRSWMEKAHAHAPAPGGVQPMREILVGPAR